MSAEMVNLLSALRLPDIHVGIPAIPTPCDEVSVWRHSYAGEPMTFARGQIGGPETPYFLARLDVPHPDAVVAAGRDDTLAVARERHRTHRAHVMDNYQFLAAGYFPQPQDVFSLGSPDGCEGIPVRR